MSDVSKQNQSSFVRLPSPTWPGAGFRTARLGTEMDQREAAWERGRPLGAAVPLCSRALRPRAAQVTESARSASEVVKMATAP